MKVTVVTDSDDKKDSKEENTMAGTNTDNKAEDIKKSVCDMIDDILGNTKAASVSDSSSATPENGQEEDNKDKDGENKDAAQGADDSKDIQHLEAQLADATSKADSLEKELADAKAELEKVQSELKDSQTEAGELKDRCLALATANKELVADSIIAKELVAGKTTDETKDSRKEELLAMSMKDLNKLSEDTVVEDKKPRDQAHVANPTLANGEEKDSKDSNGSADTSNKATTEDNNKANKTVDDFSQDIVSKLVK